MRTLLALAFCAASSPATFTPVPLGGDSCDLPPWEFAVRDEACLAVSAPPPCAAWLRRQTACERDDSLCWGLTDTRPTCMIGHCVTGTCPACYAEIQRAWYF